MSESKKKQTAKKQSTEAKSGSSKTKVAQKDTKAQDVKDTKKLTASQRIAALEEIAMVQREQIDILAEELDQTRNTISSLAKRLNAVIQAGESGTISNDSINSIVLDESVKELKGRVDYLKNQGVLKLNEDKDTNISEQNFVVGRQVDEDGNVVSPRVQFAVGSLDDSLKTKMLGKQLGDLVPDESSGTSLEITEIYDVVDPRVNKKFDEQPEASGDGEKTSSKQAQQ